MDLQTLFDTFSQCFGSSQNSYPCKSDYPQRSPKSTSNKAENSRSPVTGRNDLNTEEDDKTKAKSSHQNSKSSWESAAHSNYPSSKHSRERAESQRSVNTSSQRSADSPDKVHRNHPPLTPRSTKTAMSQDTRSPRSRRKHVRSASPSPVTPRRSSTPCRERRSGEILGQPSGRRSSGPGMTKDDIFRFKDRSRSTGSNLKTRELVTNALCFANTGQANQAVGADIQQWSADKVSPNESKSDSTAHEIITIVPTTDTADLSVPTSMFFERTASQLQKEELMPLYNQFSVPIQMDKQDGLSDVLATRSETRSSLGICSEQLYCKQLFVAAGGHDYFLDPTSQSKKSMGQTPQRKRTESTMSLSNTSANSSTTLHSGTMIQISSKSRDDKMSHVRSPN